MNFHVALFLVQNTYPANGHQYWHGFIKREDAADFMKKFAVLDIASSTHFGAVTLDAKQLVESRRPFGCVVNPEQMSKTLKEVFFVLKSVSRSVVDGAKTTSMKE